MSVQADFWKTQQEQLHAELANFEQCASTPFVPGELDSWLDEVRTAWQALWPQLQVQTQYIHAKEFAQIAHEDPELSCRVREMREEDTALMALTDQLSDQLKWMEKRLEEGTAEPEFGEKVTGPDNKDIDPTSRDFQDKGAMETDLKQDLDQFVTESLSLVSRIRKQEITVRTWLMEAYTRDKGVMD
jgi:hypothetical protein